MTPETENDWSAKRRLILRDALTFLSLALITAVLFAVTLFLFRSFATHREELAQRWAARGQAALVSGHPDQAIVALRTALSHAPGQRSYELLLAQALADAGHTEEAYNYFLGLWETQPGDGFINLRLARLAAKKNDMQAAINYYRAAIYGTWEGDGTVRRRDVRLELSRYLIAHHDLSSARTELLVTGGNAPDDVSLALTLAQLLEQASAPHDALNYYQKVLTREPDNQQALEAAGRLEYGFGHLEEAHRLLERAKQEHDASAPNQPWPPDLQAMLDTSKQILSIEPSKKLPAQERVSRILRARDLAKKRFDNCKTQVSAASASTSPLQDLVARWTSKETTINRDALLNDTREQDAVMKLVYDTETQTSQICGPPTGDDALLLMIAKSPKAVEP
ncbi:MAG TPA: tetratricopeptide repeat protein [Edaphobacter sp.]|jgi:tetratricopeptide (TPR) repeat protein|nr:tetratricopeptide repeat protein [Edaphobacter sp.]